MMTIVVLVASGNVSPAPGNKVRRLHSRHPPFQSDKKFSSRTVDGTSVKSVGVLDTKSVPLPALPPGHPSTAGSAASRLSIPTTIKSFHRRCPLRAPQNLCTFSSYTIPHRAVPLQRPTTQFSTQPSMPFSGEQDGSLQNTKSQGCCLKRPAHSIALQVFAKLLISLLPRFPCTHPRRIPPRDRHLVPQGVLGGPPPGVGLGTGARGCSTMHRGIATHTRGF